MKKIVALVIMMLGFGFTAAAQTAAKPAKAAVASQSSFAEAAKKDVVTLDKAVVLSAAQKQSFQGLFEYKFTQFKEVASSTERKAIISQTIEAKIRATLTPEQMAKLDAKPEVLKQIVQ